MNNKKPVLLLTLCLSFFFVSFHHPQLAHAHKMIVDQVENGIVQVRYDDGSPAKLALVSSFDQDGELLFEGEVDEDGYFHYDKEAKVYRFVADDGLGHRAALVKEEEESFIESIPLFIRTLLGIAFLLFIAAFFLYRSHSAKKNKDLGG